MKHPALIVTAALIFMFLAIAPVHALVYWGNTWNSGWNYGYNTFTYSSGYYGYPVNYHNQWVTYSSVTPVGTYSNINWVRTAHPMHFGYFYPGFVSW
jgi:hypothetical protein